MIKPPASKSLSVALASILMLSGASIASAENSMSKTDKMSTKGSAAASDLKLTDAQEQMLWTEIHGQAMKQTAPSGFRAEIGQTLPTSVTLRALPDKAATEVPVAKPYQYAVVDNKILLVNPSDKKIVDIIAQKS